MHLFKYFYLCKFNHSLLWYVTILFSPFQSDAFFRISGRHTVEILHAGLAIMGSPFFVEIYDPNKIRVEGKKTGTIGERMEFDSKFCIY